MTSVACVCLSVFASDMPDSLLDVLVCWCSSPVSACSHKSINCHFSNFLSETAEVFAQDQIWCHSAGLISYTWLVHCKLLSTVMAYHSVHLLVLDLCGHFNLVEILNSLLMIWYNIDFKNANKIATNFNSEFSLHYVIAWPLQNSGIWSKLG